MTFTSVSGHLMGLDFAHADKRWSDETTIHLYSAPVVKSVPPDKKEQETQLQQLARSCQWLVLWLDGDREGENISFEVIQVCYQANPRLVIKRARFSALTPQQLHRTVNSLGAPNENEAIAVDARRVPQQSISPLHNDLINHAVLPHAVSQARDRPADRRLLHSYANTAPSRQIQLELPTWSWR